MRFLLFTGKGGTGKTTISALTAIKAASLGCKTLVMSVDPAHSLSDSLQKELGPEPTEIAPNLYGQELDVYYSMKKYWGNLRDLLMTVLGWQGISKIMAEELAALPGMEEASAFLWLEKYYSEKSFDVVIIDSAPTGETLTFLTLPQATQWWIKRTMPLGRFAVKAATPFVRVATGLPVDKGYEEFERLLDKLAAIKTILGDSSKSSMRLVVNPEKMVVQEARRAYTYLQLYGYAVDGVVINRELPEEAAEGYLKAYYDDQKKYLNEIEANFGKLKSFRLKHQGKEVNGFDHLKEIAEVMYKDVDPMEIFPSEKTFDLREAGGKYLLRLSIPYVEGKVHVSHKGQELIVQVGAQRAFYALPNMLAYRKLGNYSYQDGDLLIEFEGA